VPASSDHWSTRYAGCQVAVIDDFSTGRRENLRQWADDDRVEVIEGSIVDGLFAPHAVTTRRAW
jgi:hypothetical protein